MSPWPSALRNYATVEAISDFIPATRALLSQWIQSDPEHARYFGRLDRQLMKMGQEMRRKQRSDRLIRQIFLIAAFGAYVLELLDNAKAPSAIQWISDQDAMFDRYDGLAFDLAFLLWLVSRSSKANTPSPVPRLAFGLPGMDGVNQYAELIRLPDYLAGVLAELALPEMTFSHGKFQPVFEQVFVAAANNTVVQVAMEGAALVTRRLMFGTPRSAWQPLKAGAWLERGEARGQDGV
jgi:hypothetical protein